MHVHSQWLLSEPTAGVPYLEETLMITVMAICAFWFFFPLTASPPPVGHQWNELAELLKPKRLLLLLLYIALALSRVARLAAACVGLITRDLLHFRLPHLGRKRSVHPKYLVPELAAMQMAGCTHVTPMLTREPTVTNLVAAASTAESRTEPSAPPLSSSIRTLREALLD